MNNEQNHEVNCIGHNDSGCIPDPTKWWTVEPGDTPVYNDAGEVVEVIKATFEPPTSVPKGLANASLVDALRGHAQWLALKGYDHVSKLVHWAANIIEGLKC